MEDLKTFNDLLIHAQMLADVERMSTYRNAITEVVKEGMVVSDLGTGTGVLTAMCCQAGASRVYAVERLPIIQVAREIFQKQGWGDRVTCIEQSFTEVNLPEKVDVIVHELLGSFGVGETAFGDIIAYRDRHLKPDGVMIPAKVRMVMAPISNLEYYNILSFADTHPLNLDLTTARNMSLNSIYGQHLKDEWRLGEPALLEEIDFKTISQVESETFDHHISLTIDQAGEFHGLGGWFEADLAPGVQLSNCHPGTSNSWYHMFMPLIKPVSVEVGDVVQAHIQMHCAGNSQFIWIWNTRVERPAESGAKEIANFHQNTFRGQLLTPHVVEMAANSYRPKMTDSGEVARFVYQNFDGTKTSEQLVDMWIEEKQVSESDRDVEKFRIQRMIERAWLMGDIQ